jgi:sialate O-acetylesterase
MSSLRLPRVFSDGMVLQCDAPARVWGWASPGSEVRVDLASTGATTCAGEDGTWSVDLDPSPPGGPHELTVVSGDEKLTFRDVLLGDVWVASGQSNMQFTLARADGGEQAAAKTDPMMRLFSVPSRVASHPGTDLDEGEWTHCGGAAALEFSAVAYLFGQELRSVRDVPIGLIDSSWGGTPCAAWTGLDALKALPAFRAAAEAVEADPVDLADRAPENDRRAEERQARLTQPSEALESGVHLPDFDDSDWSSQQVPIHWHNTPLKGYAGFLWYRATFEAPAEAVGKAVRLRLGKIEQKDTTYLNGVEIGQCENVGQLREYPIEAGLREGANTLAIRVLHLRNHGGGIYEGPLEIVDASTEKVLAPLPDTWRYSADAEPRLPVVEALNWKPGALFNPMIAPLTPLAIRGFIWYQGESDIEDAWDYRTLFPAMIRDWRSQWGRGDLPFLFVQIPGVLERKPKPTAHAVAELRNAQEQALALPQTAMAVTIDIGAEDFHPTNKLDVARRLALAARRVAYREEVADRGPTYRSSHIEGKAAQVEFDHAEGGLVASGGKLRGFTLAGEDRVFHRAEGRIDGQTVVLHCDAVPQPVAIRYAWEANPETSLQDAAGLPAGPFRTDSWPGLTDPKDAETTGSS